VCYGWGPRLGGQSHKLLTLWLKDFRAAWAQDQLGSEGALAP